jgi:hypothetical protein
MKTWMSLIVLLAVAVQGGEVSCFQAKWDESRKAGAAVVTGHDGWLFLPAELAFLSKGVFWGDAAAAAGTAANPAHRDPLPAVEDFARQLKAAGIRLVILPVPPKALVHADRLGCTAEEAAAEGRHLDGFYEELRRRGIEVLDLRADLLAKRDGPDLYCRTDTHWAAPAIRLAAARLADLLGGLAGSSHPYSMQEREVDITGDLVRMAGAGGTERLRLDFVADAAGQPPADDPASPILLLGDSHVLVFHAGGDLHATGAGLPDHLAERLGRPVDVLGVRGSGATTSRISLMRRARAKPEYLAGKQVVIWCFGAREFTEADAWRPVPLGP